MAPQRLRASAPEAYHACDGRTAPPMAAGRVMAKRKDVTGSGGQKFDMPHLAMLEPMPPSPIPATPKKP
jgi:hypothetical protein